MIQKKAVVTGGSGFVGTHLVQELINQEYQVIAMDLRMPQQLVLGASYAIDDARILKNCLNVFEGADIVFNLAAKVAGVEYNQNNHLAMLAENLPLQVTPIQAADRLNIPIVQISSVCVYPDGDTSPCDERKRVENMVAPNEANLGYAMAKRTGEIAASVASVRAIIARPTNIYGPGDDFGENSHVIPALIKKALTDEVIEVNGSGEEIREFIYVKDVATSLVHLANDGTAKGIYNIGTTGRTAAKIKQVVSIIQAATDTRDKKVVFKHKFNAGDNKRYTTAFNLEASGYKANTTLEDGIGETVKWWRRNNCN